jgi:hypothetical protein
MEEEEGGGMMGEQRRKKRKRKRKENKITSYGQTEKAYRREFIFIAKLVP